MDSGTAIRDARIAAGLTQAELAERSGTSQGTLSAYERGHKTPTAQTLARVLAASGARLVTERAARPVASPGANELARRGRGLLRVIELAAELPVRHAPRVAYPRLPSAPSAPS